MLFCSVIIHGMYYSCVLHFRGLYVSWSKPERTFGTELMDHVEL